jgi:arsenate reductase
VEDPAAVEGTPEEIARAFEKAFVILERRIRLLLALPLTELERMEVEQELREIGKA